MFRLKITGYVSASVRSRSVDHWILSITCQAEVTSWYGVNLLIVEISANVLL